MRILIVEDTPYLADAIAHILKRGHYEVDVAHDGATGLQYARKGIYDVIVLDNMLPKLSGTEVSQKLRNENIHTPIIIISAKSEVDDRIEGLDSGADDYLVKPFKMNELLARIRAATRRAHHQLNGDKRVIGNTSLSPATSEITGPAGTEALTAKEFLLLELLVSSARKIVSKEALFRRAWGCELLNEDTYVEVYISYIRKKLQSTGSNLTIKAVRGLGYILKEPT